MSNIIFKRNICEYASHLLENFPALAIIGARQVGKTHLSKTIAPDFHYLDLQNLDDYERITSDINFFFKQHPNYVIFDEAQIYPGLFSALRGVIDSNRKQKGRFILTCSSNDELLTNISESLAGRIAIIELGTLKANEYYHKPLSSFYHIFNKRLNRADIELIKPNLSYKEIQDFWIQGGYPEPILSNNNIYYEWMVDYESTYLNRDLARLFPKLDKIAYRRFLKMLAKLSSKIINKSDIARSVNVAEPTIANYLDIACGTFLWRHLPSYEGNIQKSVVKMPKGHIRDSGLLHFLLKISSLEDLQSDPIAGYSFEAFVIEEILKGLQDAQIRSVNAYYYRTRSGSEIDLILEGSFGLLPIEIKYGCTVIGRQLRTMKTWIKDHNVSFGIVVNQNDEMRWLTEEILQVPMGCL